MKKASFVFVAVVIVLSALLTWKLLEQKRAEEAPPTSSGVVESTRMVVSARISSRVTKMYSREGDHVKVGTLLSLLDCEEQDAAVSASQARLLAAEAQIRSLQSKESAAGLQAQAASRNAEGQQAQAGSIRIQEKKAKKDSDRAKRLYKEKVGDEVTVENLETSVEDIQERLNAARAATLAAEASSLALQKQAAAVSGEIAAAKKQMEAVAADLKRVKTLQAECRVTAPASGIITQRAKEPGEVVLPGTPLFELRSLSDIRIKFYVRNADLAKFKVGAKVHVSADAFPDKIVEAQVSWISEEAEYTPRNIQTKTDRDRLVYAAEAVPLDFSSSAFLRSGLPVEVTLWEKNNQ